jgi:hypothetical protein
LDKLYDHIVRQFVMKDELIDVDLAASASEEGRAIESEKHQIVARETDHARQMRESFRAGLSTAWELQKNGPTELRLCDQDPVENSIADALIRYLVSYGLASSRTEQTGEASYRYYISVHWPKLAEIGAVIGVDLESTLAAAS